MARKLYGVEEDPDLDEKADFDFVFEPEETDHKDLNIVAYAPDMGACGHYRVRFPLQYLASEGVPVNLMYAPTILDLDLRPIAKASHVILSRCVHRDLFLAVRTACNRAGATLVFDLDDNFNEIDPLNPAYGLFRPDTAFGNENRANLRLNLEASDGILFATRELQGYYSDDFPDSHLSPNGLDISVNPQRWATEKRFDWKALAARQACKVNEQSLLFGWMGSITHIGDLEPMRNVIHAVLQQNPTAFFGIYSDVELAMHLCITRWHLPRDRFVFIPPTVFAHYPKKISAFDVGIAPLTNNAFNRGKSDIRLMEMGAMGVPYVASKVAPYYRYHLESKGYCGLMATADAEWVAAINALLRDPDRRAVAAVASVKYARRNCDVSQRSRTLLYTLRTLRENARSHTKAPGAMQMHDLYRGIPLPQKDYALTDPCPCGSGDAYAYCGRGCYPAWGEAVP